MSCESIGAVHEVTLSKIGRDSGKNPSKTFPFNIDPYWVQMCHGTARSISIKQDDAPTALRRLSTYRAAGQPLSRMGGKPTEYIC